MKHEGATTELLPRPSKPLVLRTNDTLADLVDAFSDATGIPVLADADARRVLQITKLELGAPRELALAEVYPFVETVLVQNECALTIPSARAPRILRIVTPRGLGADRYRTLAGPIDVEPAELDRWAATHPALPLRMLLRVEHGDVGSIVDALKGEISDGITQSVTRLGSSRFVILFGFAPWLRAQRDLLARIDVRSQAVCSTDSPQR